MFQCEIVKQNKRKKGKITNNHVNKTYIKKSLTEMDPRMLSHLKWNSLWLQSRFSLLLTCGKELQHSCHKSPGSGTDYHNIIKYTLMQI